MDNGQEVTAAFEHGREAEIEFHQQGFIGVVHDLELVGEKDAPSRVRIVQMYLGFVNKHVSIITVIDKARKDCAGVFGGI